MNGMPVSVEGEGTPIHWGCAMGVVLLVAAGLALYLLAGRSDPDDIECLQNLARIADGADASDFMCPVVQAPYRIEREEERQTVSCPDPDGHLEYRPHFARDNGDWVFQADLPQFSPPQDQVLELGAGLRELRLELDPVETRVRVRGAWYYRFLLGPLLTLLGAALAFVSGGFAIGIYHAHAKAAREAKTGSEARAEIAAGLTTSLILVSVTILSVLFVVAQVQSFSRTREVEFSKTGHRVQIQDSYFGRSWSEARTIRGVAVLYPVAAGRHREVVVTYPGESQWEQETLFSVSQQDAGVIRFLWELEVID